MTFLNLDPRFVLGKLDVTEYPFAVNQEGIDFQTGDLVTSVLSSFLLDGDIEVSQRRGNMTLAIPILIEGSDLAVLADSLKALAYESEKQTNTLAIDPGDGFGAVTVFETFRGNLDYTYNAKAEQNGFRQYTLTMRALPHGRSVTQVVAAAVPVGTQPPTVTTVTVTDASSTTAWSLNGGTLSSNGSYVQNAGGVYIPGPGVRGLTLTYTAAIDTSVTKKILVDWYASPAGNNPRIQINGEALVYNPVAMGIADTPGYTRSIYEVPYSSLSSISFSVTEADGGNILRIDRILRTDSVLGGATGREQVRTVAVEGSARTQGSLAIYSPTSGLGDVLAYTWANDASGYLPMLRSFKAAGSTDQADPSGLSGSYNTLNADLVFDVPLSVLPTGQYALIARVSTPSSGVYASAINWSTQTYAGTTGVGRTYAGSTSFSAVAADGAFFLPICSLQLPNTGARSNSTGKQRIVLRDANSASTNIRVDQVYACNLTTGDVSIVRCGSGTPSAGGPSSRLWLDSATVISRTASVMRGFAADGSDAFYAGDSIMRFGQHEFVPDSMNTLIASSGATDVQANYSHYPRWLGHAAS